jgi:hypothetical protein
MTAWELYNQLGTVKGLHDVVLANDVTGQYEQLTALGLHEVEIDGETKLAFVIGVP